MRQQKMKGSDVFVNNVRNCKIMLCGTIIGTIIFSIIIFLFAVFASNVNATKIDQKEQIHAYKTETGWAVYKSSPDQLIKDPPAKWSISQEDQKKLIEGEEEIIKVFSFIKNGTKFWGGWIPNEEEVFSSGEAFLEGDNIKINLLETQVVFSKGKNYLLFFPFLVILLGIFTGNFASKRKDRLLIIRIILGLGAVFTLTIIEQGLSVEKILPFLLSLILGLCFFYLHENSKIDFADLLVVALISMVLSVGIGLMFSTYYFPNFYYFSLCYFIPYILSFFWFMRKEKKKRKVVNSEDEKKKLLASGANR